jgi:hypothetical protein
MRKAAWLLVPSLACTTASGQSRSDEAPLVLELFTSQGCSSCPPADELLAKLARDGAVGGRPVAPLAFHVDYWDDLGWPDPFAQPAWTARQRRYADTLDDDRIYTPELVVGGRVGLVGSQATSVVRAIADAPKQLKLTASATWSTNRVTIEAQAPGGSDVYVAIWQDGTRTNVARGENAGATLVGDRVVRKLERVATAGTTGTATIAIDPTWSGAIAFAQKPDGGIIGSALLPR